MEIVILALSYKKGGICLAGLKLDTLEFVRIGHGSGNVCKPMCVAEMRVNNHLLQIMDIVDVEATKLSDDGCQTENYSFIRFVDYLGELKFSELDAIYKKIPKQKFIFKNNYRKVLPEHIKEVNNSLGLFKVSNLKVVRKENSRGLLSPYSSFDYNNYRYSDLSTTDARISGFPREYGVGIDYLEKESAYILVSLPPKSDPYTSENGYFKYVSGIIIES